MILLVPTLALGAAALADPPIVVQGQQLPPAPNPEKKIICKNTPIPGSRFTERKCETKLAWDKQEDEANRAWHEVTSRPVVNTGFDDGHGF
jgi:hypothetical protein